MHTVAYFAYASDKNKYDMFVGKKNLQRSIMISSSRNIVLLT